MKLLVLALLQRILFLASAGGAAFACGRFSGTGAAWAFGLIAFACLFMACSDITLTLKKTDGGS